MDWCVTSPLASAAYRGYRAAFSVAVHTAQMLAQGSATPAPSVFTEAVRLDLRMLSDARREMAAEITASGGSLANISISGAGWNQFAADVRVNGAPTIEVDLLAAVFEAAQIALPDSAGASLAQWIQEDPSYAETGFARAPAGAWQMADYLNMSAGWFEARMQEIPAAAAIDAATLDEGLRKLVLSAGAVIGADGQVPVTAGTPLGAVVSASRLSLPDFLIRNPVTVRLSDVRISLLSSGGGTAASARPAVSVLPAPKTIAAPAPLASAAAPKPIGAMPVRPSTLVMNPDASAPRPVASPAVAAGLTAARALAASGGSAGAVAIGTPFAALSNGNGGANGEVVDALAVLLQAIAKADSTTSAPGSNAPQALIQAVGGLGDPASANPPANGDYLPGQMSAGLPV
jgi:hypothetical protein